MSKSRYAIVITLLALFLEAAAVPARASGYAIDQKMDETTARAMLNRFGYGADALSLAATMQETPSQYLMQYLMRAIQGKSRLPTSVAAQIQSLPMTQPIGEIWDQ